MLGDTFTFIEKKDQINIWEFYSVKVNHIRSIMIHIVVTNRNLCKHPIMFKGKQRLAARQVNHLSFIIWKDQRFTHFFKTFDTERERGGGGEKEHKCQTVIDFGFCHKNQNERDLGSVPFGMPWTTILLLFIASKVPPLLPFIPP